MKKIMLIANLLIVAGTVISQAQTETVAEMRPISTTSSAVAEKPTAPAAATTAASDQILPGAGLASTQPGGSGVFVRVQEVGGKSATAKIASLNVNVEAPQPPQMPQQMQPKKKGFFGKVGQALGMGAFQSGFTPAPWAQYGATGGAVGVSQFGPIPYRTTEQVRVSNHEREGYSFYGAPTRSRSSSYSYRKEHRPAVGVPSIIAPTSYVDFHVQRSHRSPDRSQVSGGSTQVWSFGGGGSNHSQGGISSRRTYKGRR